MTAPWEETWKLSRVANRPVIYALDSVGHGAGMGFGVISLESHATTKAAEEAKESLTPRMALAACAPEMARLLKKMHDNPEDDCPWCGGFPQHYDSCDLEAVLKKAGVLP